MTWLGEHWTVSLNDVKQAVDGLFVSGVNHVFFHGTAYSPDEAVWPGWLFYASTQFNDRNAFWRDLPALNEYIARVQSVLQSGVPDNDVLLYWPVFDNWHDAEARPRMDFRVHDPEWFHGKPLGEVAKRSNNCRRWGEATKERMALSMVRQPSTRRMSGKETRLKLRQVGGSS